MDKKNKVGRPKLADEKLKNNAKIMIILSSCLIIILLFLFLVTNKSINLNAIKGSSNIQNKKCIIYYIKSPRNSSVLYYSVKCNNAKIIDTKYKVQNEYFVTRKESERKSYKSKIDFRRDRIGKKVSLRVYYGSNKYDQKTIVIGSGKMLKYVNNSSAKTTTKRASKKSNSNARNNSLRNNVTTTKTTRTTTTTAYENIDEELEDENIDEELEDENIDESEVTTTKQQTATTVVKTTIKTTTPPTTTSRTTKKVTTKKTTTKRVTTKKTTTKKKYYDYTTGKLKRPISSNVSSWSSGTKHSYDSLHYSYGSWHGGNDLSTGGKIGYDVYAMDGGLVVKADVKTNKCSTGSCYNYNYKHYGKFVLLKHKCSNGRVYYSVYGHLSKVLVKAGNIVKKGDVIALSGNTGHSTGPHLHVGLSYKTYSSKSGNNVGYPIYDKNVLSPYAYISGSKKGKTYCNDSGKNN